MKKKRLHSRILTLSCLIVAIFLLTSYIFFSTPPKPAFAFPNKLTYCEKGGCHTTADADATQYVARDAIDITSGPSIFIGAGQTFELDWYANNASYSGATTYGTGVQILIPTNWTAAAGTSNSPNLTNWNSVWNIADGVAAGWGSSYTANVPAGFLAYTIDYTSSNWDHADSAAYDDASSGTPGDRDLVANRMGTDAKVTASGSASGDYSIYVDNVGHDTASNKKSYERTILNVRVANITSLSTDKSSYNTLGENILVTGNYNNTSTSTNLTSSTINYQIFIDSNSNGNLDSGETYIDSAGYPQTASTGNETTKVTSSFNVNANTTVQDQWSINNQYFTTATNYTLKAIWKESNGGVIDVEKSAAPFYTFYSVPTLSWYLTLMAIGMFTLLAVRKGALRLRRTNA